MYTLTVIGSQKSKISSKNQNQNAGRIMFPLDAPGGNLSPASSSLWWLLAFLGLWPHHLNLCFCGHIVLSPSTCVKSPLVSLLSGHPDKPWKSPHIKILGQIIPTKSLPCKWPLEELELGHKIFEGHYSAKDIPQYKDFRSALKHSLKNAMFAYHFG